MQALEITKQRNILTIAFPPLASGIFGFSTDTCAIIMLRSMRYFISKNSNLSLKIIRVVVNDIRQVKTFTRIEMKNNTCFFQKTNNTEETLCVATIVI